MKAILPHNSRWAGFGSDPYGPDDPRIAREVIDSLFLVTTDRDVPDWITLSGRMNGDQATAITTLDTAIASKVKSSLAGYFSMLAFWLDPRNVIVSVNPDSELGPSAAGMADRVASVLESVDGVAAASKLSGPEYFAYVIEGRKVGDVPSGGNGTGGLEDEYGPPRPGDEPASSPSGYKVPPWAWAAAGLGLLAVVVVSTRKRA